MGLLLTTNMSVNRRASQRKTISPQLADQKKQVSRAWQADAPVEDGGQAGVTRGAETMGNTTKRNRAGSLVEAVGANSSVSQRK